MLSDLLMWNKIGRIIARLSDTLGINISRALDIFYNSQVCKDLHDPEIELNFAVVKIKHKVIKKK